MAKTATKPKAKPAAKKAPAPKAAAPGITLGTTKRAAPFTVARDATGKGTMPWVIQDVKGRIVGRRTRTDKLTPIRYRERAAALAAIAKIMGEKK